VIRLITLLVLSSMTVMAGATIAPALPKIRVFFQMAPEVDFWVKLLLTIPALFTAISAPFAGALIDRFGRKPLLICAVILYGLAGSSGLFLEDLSSLLAGRALLGLAVGGIMTTATALVADYYQGQKRNQVMGIQAAFMGYGGVAFLLLGGFLADLDWRYPFLIYLIAFAIVPLALFSLAEPRSKSAKFKEPDKAPERLSKITLASIYGLTFLSMVAFYMIPVQIPFYLQSTGTLSGIAIASCTLASALVSMRYRSIKNSFSFQGILVMVYLLMGLGYLGISLSPSYWFVVVSLIIAGAGLGLLMPNMNVWINAIAPVKFRGRALGGGTSAMFLGQFFSPILIQPIADKITLRATYGAVGGMLWGIAIVVIFAAILNRTGLRASSK
jgi:MFS family permease